MCLFDGCKFVGNVHVFTAAKAVEEEDEPWVFINKVSILPSSVKSVRQREYEICCPKHFSPTVDCGLNFLSREQVGAWCSTTICG